MKSKIFLYTTVVFFLVLTFGWLIINYLSIDTLNTYSKNLFSNVYGIMALWGGILGIIISKEWGGLKSYIGRSIFLISLGLLFQELGQLSYAYYYFFLQLEEIPYPSFGDIFFLSSTPLYAWGAILLVKATWTRDISKNTYNKIIVILIPTLILVISKLLFLPDYEFDWSNPILIFFDIGYPIGQAIYISIALLAYLFSQKYLGGNLKWPILIIIIALVLQYIADYFFTYLFHKEALYPGELSDYTFFLAYFVMTYGLIQFSLVADKLNTSNGQVSTSN